MATFPSFTAGQRLTAAQLTDLRDLTRTVVKTLDESVASSVTFQDDDELFLSVDANAVYEYELTLFTKPTTGGGAANGDIRLTFTFPSGATCSGAGQGAGNTSLTTGSQASGEWTGRPSITSGASGTRFPYGLSTDAATTCAVIVGQLDMGATAGTFRLQWAQEASSANATIVMAGSRLKLQRTA